MVQKKFIPLTQDEKMQEDMYNQLYNHQVDDQFDKMESSDSRIENQILNNTDRMNKELSSMAMSGDFKNDMSTAELKK